MKFPIHHLFDDEIFVSTKLPLSQKKLYKTLLSKENRDFNLSDVGILKE